jgi:hypothetical protein
MRELEGRPIAEIAGILDVSKSAVETLLFRARRGVREQLEGGLTCAEAEEAISRQLDGQLKRRERGALRAHLRECEECASLARSLRAQRGAIKSLGAIPLPAALAWSKFGAGAAAGGVASASAGVTATGGAWIVGSSIAAKLGGATLLAALAGAGYVAAVDHPWTAAGPVATVPVRLAATPGQGNSSTAPGQRAASPSAPLKAGASQPSIRGASTRSAAKTPRAGARATTAPAVNPPAPRAHSRATAAAPRRAEQVTRSPVGHRDHSKPPKRTTKPAHRTKRVHPVKTTHSPKPTHSAKPTATVPTVGSSAPKKSHSQLATALASLFSTSP